MPTDVLIVDDEPAVRQLLTMVVRTMHMTSCEAEDAADALEKIEADPPRMIILDVMMPRMDGVTMLRKLRAEANTAVIPVLLFTTFRVPSHDVADLNIPASMIMSKGAMSVSAIRAAIREALQEAKESPPEPSQPEPAPAQPAQAAQPVQVTLKPAPANRLSSPPAANHPSPMLKPLSPRSIDAK